MAASIERLQSAISDRYTVERELGRGGMATVYLARDVKHDRQVAIKVLHTDVSAALNEDRFRREIQVATHLSHPHILPIYDSGEADGTLYYVMPYVPGESLRAKMTRERQLAVPEAVEITCEVAAALDYAHRRGVVHRDIKPENILLADGQAVVADFGIAHAVSSAGEDRLTMTGVTLGTPTYMSPEQATAERDLDGRSDVYALGCVLYEMLVGQPPFVGPNAQAIIARHTMEHVPSLTIVRNTIPPQLEGVVMKALAKSPADRFATAAKFAEALRDPSRASLPEWTMTHATAAQIQALGARGGRGRKRLLWGVLLAVVLAGGAVATWRLTRHQGATRGALDGPDPRHVAVLYFDDESPDHHLGFLADGLTEALIARLSTVDALTVTSANGSALYRHKDVPRDSIARALHVGTLVDGSVEEHGNRVTVTVKLKDASGADFKRASFDAPAGNGIAIADTLAQRVAQFLRSRLGEEISMRQERAGAGNPNAWAMVQQAQEAMKQADSLADLGDTASVSRAYTSADSMLEHAAALDPTWVTPVVLRGSVDYHRSRVVSSPTAIDTLTTAGLRYAERAVTMQPNDPAALELRGTLHYWRHLNGLAHDPRVDKELVASAERDLRAAVDFDPHRASAWSVLAHLYFNKPDAVDGLLASRKAYEEDAYLSAAPDILWRLYGGSFELEKFPDASGYCDEGRRRFPKNPRFVLCRLYLLAAGSQRADVRLAWALVDTLGTLTPKTEWEFQRREADMLVAGALVHAALPDSARHVLLRSRGDPGIDPGRDLLGDEAWIRTMLGDKDEAIRLIKEYLVANPQHRAGMASNENWQWRSLRDDPRFRALVGTGQ